MSDDDIEIVSKWKEYLRPEGRVRCSTLGRSQAQWVDQSLSPRRPDMRGLHLREAAYEHLSSEVGLQVRPVGIYPIPERAIIVFPHLGFSSSRGRPSRPPPQRWRGML